MKTAMIILAAGASSRMGTHKALLELDGEALVVRAVRVAREAGCVPLVVLGAEAARIVPLLGGCEHVVNHAWEAGMGGSIACGVRALGADYARVGVMTVDQPGVDAAQLVRLVEACGGDFEASASIYEGGRCGVPAVFSGRGVEMLGGLVGERGAGALLSGGGLRVARVEGIVVADVDTPEEWRAFKERRDAGC